MDWLLKGVRFLIVALNSAQLRVQTGLIKQITARVSGDNWRHRSRLMATGCQSSVGRWLNHRSMV